MPTDNESGRPRRAARVAKIVIGGAAALVVLPIAALAIVAWTVDLGGLVRGRLDEMRPAWEQQLGRPILLGEMHAHLFPTIEVEVRGVGIGPAPGATGEAAKPLFELGTMRVGIAAWPLLRSLGKDVRVSRIEAHGPRLTVVRGADGRLSYADITERLQSEDRPPPKPLTPEQLTYIRGVQLARFAILDAHVRFVDEGAGARERVVSIDQMDLVASGVRVEAPFSVTFDAAVLAPARNVHLAVEVAPLPVDLEVAQPMALLRRLALRVQPFEVEPILKFLPASPGVELSRARVEADLAVELPAAAAKLRVAGSAAARGLVLQRAVGKLIERGVPADVTLATDLTIDPLAGDLAIQKLDVGVNAMGVSGSADLRALWTQPAVHALAIASRGLTLDGLASILPPSSLPKGAVLKGPLAITAKGSGTPAKAHVEVALDLDGATISVPQLRKPAGTALDIGLRGDVAGGAIDIARLGVVLGPLQIALHGRYRSADNLDLTLDEGKVQLDPLLRLLPSVADAVPAGQTLAGDLSFLGSVHRHGAETQASARVALKQADARAPSVELVGGAIVAAEVKATKGAASVQADVDLSEARVRLAGAVDKAAGVPMRLKLDGARAGTRYTIKEARLSLPGGAVEAEGSADLAARAMSVRLPSADLDLGQLARVVPALRGSLPAALADARVKFALAFDGDPGKLAAARAKIDQLSIAAAGTNLTGSASVVGLDEPKQVSFDLRGDAIDLDRLLPAGDEPKAEGGGRAKAGGGTPKILKTLVADGKLQVASGTYQKMSFRDLTAQLALRDGKATFQVLSMKTFGGAMTATGSSFDFTGAQPKFTLRGKLSNVELAQVIALRSPLLASKLRGQGNLDLSVDGAGLSWAEIAPKVSGQLGLLLADGALKVTPFAQTALKDVLSRVKGLTGELAIVDEDMSLKDLSTTLRVQDGQLRTTRPIQLGTRDGALKLEGAVGLDQKLALTGNIELQPAVIERLTQGRIKLAAPLPLDLRVGGELTAPRVEVVNVEKLALQIGAALVASQGRQVLEGALGRGVGGQVGEAAGQVLQQGDLEAAKREAQKRLEEEARKRIGNVLGGGGFQIPTRP